MEEANGHLMTPTQEAAQPRGDTAGMACLGGTMPCRLLPEQDQGANSCSLGIQNDSFPGSRAGNPVASPGWGCLGLLDTLASGTGWPQRCHPLTLPPEPCLAPTASWVIDTPLLFMTVLAGY